MCRVWTYLSRGFNSSGHTSTDHLGISGIQHVPKFSLIDRRCHGVGDNFGENGCGNNYFLKRENSETTRKITKTQREVIKVIKGVRIIHSSVAMWVAEVTIGSRDSMVDSTMRLAVVGVSRIGLASQISQKDCFILVYIKDLFNLCKG